MKFFALSLMALGAAAAPSSYTQVHHTVGLGHTQTANIHKQVVATPITTYNKVVEPITTYNKIVEPITAFNKIQTVAYAQPTAYVQPTTYVKPAVQYVSQPAVQYVAQPTVQYVAQPAVQTAQYRHHEVTLPVHQVDRTVQYLDTPHVEKPADIQMVRIGATSNPLHIHFDTQSSQLTTSQSHLPVAPAEPKYQEAQDDASYLKTDIKKPVVQSVTETVYPQREIKQLIAPLTETVNTVVSRATSERAQYVAPQPTIQHVQPVQTFVKPVETVQTFVKPVETVQTFVKPVEIAQTFVKPVETVQTFVKPVETVQTFVKPAETFVQGQTVEYVKPVQNYGTTILKPTTLKNVVVEKAAETIQY